MTKHCLSNIAHRNTDPTPSSQLHVASLEQSSKGVADIEANYEMQRQEWQDAKAMLNSQNTLLTGKNDALEAKVKRAGREIEKVREFKCEVRRERCEERSDEVLRIFTDMVQLHEQQLSAENTPVTRFALHDTVLTS